MITIHDPDVVFTDLGLAALGTYCGMRLWRLGGGVVTRRGAVVMWGLASAAFWGAIYHAFFPVRTAAAFAIWLLVAFSIAVVAETLIDLALRALFPALTGMRRAVVLTYCVLFAGVIVFLDQSFSTIVLFYAPAVLLMLVAAVRQGWTLVGAGLLVSAAAALLQRTQVAIHPVYFDHNAVYHVVQAAALVLLYLGFRGQRADQAVSTG